MYLRVEEGTKDGNGRSQGVDRLDRRAEDDDRGDYDGYPLHRVSDTEC